MPSTVLLLYRCLQLCSWHNVSSTVLLLNTMPFPAMPFTVPLLYRAFHCSLVTYHVFPCNAFHCSLIISCLPLFSCYTVPSTVLLLYRAFHCSLVIPCIQLFSCYTDAFNCSLVIPCLQLCSWHTMSSTLFSCYIPCLSLPCLSLFSCYTMPSTVLLLYRAFHCTLAITCLLLLLCFLVILCLALLFCLALHGIL